MTHPGDSGRLRSLYFRLVFGRGRGYACLAALTRGTVKKMREQFFMIPDEFDRMMAAIDEMSESESDLYFCPQLFKSPERRRENVAACPSLWADLDECTPDIPEPAPSITTETSPGRYQGVWLLEDVVEPEAAEAICKKIAYAYAEQGCDRSGWDLTQLLRVPGTKNYKYLRLGGTDSGPVEVRLLGGSGPGGRPTTYRSDDFAYLPEVTIASYEKIPYPTELPTSSARQILDAFRFKLPERAWHLYEDVPQPRQGRSTWSEALFALEMILYEAGMSREQVFKVCAAAACNKFDRDGKGAEYLWQDVCRAWGKHNDNLNKLNVVDTSPIELLSDEEYTRVRDVRTFVEDYIEWASSLGDAATQYHQAGAFMILSGLLSGSVCLPTSFGRVFPNLWFMLLADTTLTRKSTAMDIATDLLIEVDSDVVMATDGSIEGLMTGLASRPGRPSMFLRDEFSGLIEQITKKEYYAGMSETLTKLYDGKLQKRMLRKEIIEVRDPRLVIFAAGIKRRTQQLLTFDHISSGFIPRFLFITAESDVSRVQPLGPPTDMDLSGRTALLDQMADMYNFYKQEELYELPNGVKLPKARITDATLTEEAWLRYNKFEADMLQAGLDSERPELMTPLYDRLAKSTLKAVILLSASRQRNESVVISLDDILLGIRYAAGWRDYAVDVVNGIGKSVMENQLDAVHSNIQRNPGISRGQLMRSYHLTAREAEAIFATLEQRGLITSSKIGKGTVYNAS